MTDAPVGPQPDPASDHPQGENVYDVFLSHTHEDSSVVESLGELLEDIASLRIWLDRWTLVPGTHWQQEMARGLEQSRTCVVCIGRNTPKGWFRDEIEKALNRQSKDPTFRVIPIILPGGDSSYVDNFLELRTWVDFSEGLNDERALHLLISGVKGRSPGRPAHHLDPLDSARRKLGAIKTLHEEGLIDREIAIEFQRRLLDIIVSN